MGKDLKHYKMLLNELDFEQENKIDYINNLPIGMDSLIDYIK